MRSAERRQPGPLRSHDKLPPGFYWSRPPASTAIHEVLPQRRYQPIYRDACHLWPIDVARSLRCCTTCAIQGSRAPIQHDMCFGNWRATDKLWLASLSTTSAVGTLGWVAANHSGRESGGTLMLSTIVLVPASHHRQHRGLCRTLRRLPWRASKVGVDGLANEHSLLHPPATHSSCLLLAPKQPGSLSPPSATQSRLRTKKGLAVVRSSLHGGKTLCLHTHACWTGLDNAYGDYCR